MTMEEFDRICDSATEEFEKEAAESMAEDLARIAKDKAEKERLRKEKAKARRKKAQP